MSPLISLSLRLGSVVILAGILLDDAQALRFTAGGGH